MFFAGNTVQGLSYARLAKMLNIAAVVITVIWVTSVIVWALVNSTEGGRVSAGSSTQSPVSTTSYSYYICYNTEFTYDYNYSYEYYYRYYFTYHYYCYN